MEFKFIPLSKQQRVTVTSGLGLPATLEDNIVMIDQLNLNGTSLGMINYHPERFDPTNPEHFPLWKVKGVIVNLETGEVYARSGGHVEAMTIQKPIQSRGEDLIINEKVYPGAMLFPGYETVYLRVWKFRDTIMFSTQKKIDGRKSKWVSTDLFYDLFLNALPFPVEKLFEYGDVHPFLLVTRQTNLAASVLAEQLVYLGDDKLIEDFKGKAPETFRVKTGLIGHYCIQPEVANAILFPAQYAEAVPEDVKCHPGQMFYQQDETGAVEKVFMAPTGYDHPLLQGGDNVTMLYDGRLYRVESPSFTFRQKITNSNPTPYQEFCVGLSRDHIRLFDAPDAITYWQQLFTACVGPTLKDSVASYLERYQTDLESLVWFLKTKAFEKVPKDTYEFRFSKTARASIKLLSQTCGSDEKAIRHYIGHKLSMETTYTLCKQVSKLLEQGIIKQ